MTALAAQSMAGKGVSWERFGDFEILEGAGRGECRVVYRARQISLRRFVALKVIAPGERPTRPVAPVRARVHLAASIDHPNVVSVTAAGEIDGPSPPSRCSGSKAPTSRAIEPAAPRPARRDRRATLACGARSTAAHATGLTPPRHRPGPAHPPARRLGRDHAATRLRDRQAQEAAGGAGPDAGGRRRRDDPSTTWPPWSRSRGQAGPSSTSTPRVRLLFEAGDRQAPFDMQARVATMWAAWAQMNAPASRAPLGRSGIGPQFDEVMQRALAIEPADRYADGAEFAEALRRAAAGVPLRRGGRSPPSKIAPPPRLLLYRPTNRRRRCPAQLRTAPSACPAARPKAVADPSAG